MRSPIRVERHELGPRCYVFGQRVHEVAGGIALLAAALIIVLLRRHLPFHLTFGFFAVGAWLTAKDWPDLFPASRNTRAWRAGMHRHPDLPYRRGQWIAPLAAALTAGVGLLNIGAVLSPALSDRAYDLAHLTDGRLVVYAHALALPLGLALLVLSYYLLRRRRRAVVLTIGTLAMLVVLNLFRGEIEQSVVSAGLAGLLVWGQAAFTVQQEERRVLVALVRAGGVLAGAYAVILAAVAVAAVHRLSFSSELQDAYQLLVLNHPYLLVREDFRWLTLGAHTLAVGALLAAAYALFRPLAHRRQLPGQAARALAAELVHSHGTDTLAFFKLRGDQHYFFYSGGEAFLAYRIEAGVLLISGDPIGPPGKLAALLSELAEFAAARGLKLGCVGASESFAAVARRSGLKSLYIGDEAIVDVGAFSLEGRRIRKVRQSVTRLKKAGFSVSARPLAGLSDVERGELERISEQWRGGAPERGFSMALQNLEGEHLHDSLVVCAHDESGVIRGFLHFVPCYGRSAVSLSFMRRDRGTPNGLTEFLVVCAVEALCERGIQEMSLNFAAFGRYLRAPQGRVESVLGGLVRRFDRFFQLESLYHFNAKFFPRWQPRYLLYEDVLDLPRTGLAAMWAEGQLPKPKLARRRAASPAKLSS